MVEHTVKTFDRELDALERRIVEMGGIAEKMVIDAMDALANADTMLAHEVVAADLRLDALQREIENMAVTTIARRQPVAADLRELIGAIRIAGDLERVGDLAKNIAKRTVKVGSKAPNSSRDHRPQTHEGGGDRTLKGRARRLCAAG